MATTITTTTPATIPPIIPLESFGEEEDVMVDRRVVCYYINRKFLMNSTVTIVTEDGGGGMDAGVPVTYNVIDVGTINLRIVNSSSSSGKGTLSRWSWNMLNQHISAV